MNANYPGSPFTRLREESPRPTPFSASLESVKATVVPSGNRNLWLTLEACKCPPCKFFTQSKCVHQAIKLGSHSVHVSKQSSWWRAAREASHFYIYHPQVLTSITTLSLGSSLCWYPASIYPLLPRALWASFVTDTDAFQ